MFFIYLSIKLSSHSAGKAERFMVYTFRTYVSSHSSFSSSSSTESGVAYKCYRRNRRKTSHNGNRRRFLDCLPAKTFAVVKLFWSWPWFFHWRCALLEILSHSRISKTTDVMKPIQSLIYIQYANAFASKRERILGASVCIRETALHIFWLGSERPNRKKANTQYDFPPKTIVELTVSSKNPLSRIVFISSLHAQFLLLL